MIADASTLTILASGIAGREGAVGFNDIDGWVRAGHGGDGLHLRNGSRTTSLLGFLLGGRGGAPDGRTGAPTVLDTTSNLLVTPSARPSGAEIRGTQALGQVIEIVARGAPASPAVLALSYRADVSPIATGWVLAIPALILGPYSIPSSGQFLVPVRLPSTWPLGESYFAQFLTLQPGPNTLWASNRLVLHVNH